MDGKHNMVDEEATDIAQLWQEALKQYYINTKQDLTTLPRFTSVKAVMDDGQLKNDAFNEYRHPKTQVNKLRSAVSRNIDLIQTGAQYLAQAATPAFPPSAAILTAFTYMLKAAKDVSADYDRIIGFYDEMNSFLERVSIIEHRLPSVPAYRTILMRVFSALMNICGIATHYIAKGRFKQWAKTLLGGSDDVLKDAYGTMETALKRLESASSFATLANTEDIKYDTKAITATTQNIKISMTAGFEEVTKQISKMIVQSQKTASKVQAAPDTHKPKDPSAKKQAAFNQVKKRFAPNGDPSATESREIEFLFVKGTATWIFEHETYKSWIEDKSSVLWLTGSPGIGKTCISYSVVDALKRSYGDEAHNPVAVYYFREENNDLKSITDALGSSIFQIASRDRTYCELVANTLHHDEAVNAKGINALWNTFFTSIFTETSEMELFLVFDGLDEAHEEEVTEMLELLKQVKSQKLNIHVLITSQQSFKEKVDILAPRTIQVTQNLISADVRRLILARFKTLSRLRKFSRQAKVQIARKLREKADGMLYAEHLLRRLNSIGREGAALRYIREHLPNSLTKLYALMLAECQKRRTPEQLDTLRRLFAWLAFSKRPLTLTEASSLVSLIIGEQDLFSLDEEIEGKSARILELGRDVTENDIEETDDDPNDDDNAPLTQVHADEDASAPLRFQERSLRNYFRETDTNKDGLRTAPSTANLIIFEMAASILDRPAETLQEPAWAGLREYAAYYWSDHFRELDPDTTSERDTLTVLRSLAQIFIGKRNVSKSVETVSPDGYGYFECFAGEENSQNHVLLAARKWIQKAANLNQQEFDHDITTFIGARSEEEMVPLARAHMQNWWEGSEEAYDIVKSFEFVLSALLMVSIQRQIYMIL